MSAETYRGWEIRICLIGWMATHPDWEPGDLRQASGNTLDEVKAEIDAWHEENVS